MLQNVQTCVDVGTGLQLLSLIWAKPISYYVVPAVFVVVLAGFGALYLLFLPWSLCQQVLQTDLIYILFTFHFYDNQRELCTLILLV